MAFRPGVSVVFSAIGECVCSYILISPRRIYLADSKKPLGEGELVLVVLTPALKILVLVLLLVSFNVHRGWPRWAAPWTAGP